MANFVLSNEIARNEDPEDAMVDDNALNYKGFFFGENTEQKHFLGGAHFDYSDLCSRLKELLPVTDISKKALPADMVPFRENGISQIKPQENKVLVNDCNLKNKLQSRNKNVIINSNTMKTFQLSRNTHNEIQNHNGLAAKPSIIKSFFQNNNVNVGNSHKITNGAENYLNSGMTKYKNEKLFEKQNDIFAKISHHKKTENEITNNTFSKLKCLKKNFEIKKNVKQTSIGLNSFFLKNDTNNKNK